MKKFIIAGLFVSTAWFSIACSPAKESSAAETAWPVFYAKAGIIEVKDPLAAEVGSLPYGKNVISISLFDVGKYTGHVCPGVYMGFAMSQKALKELYPDSTPERGNIRITGNAGHDLLDVASYVTGARGNYGRGELNRGDITIDPSLSQKKEKKVIVFERKDNGQKVKVTFNMERFMQSPGFAEMKTLKGKTEAGSATDEERQKLAKMMQKRVRRLIENNGPDRMLSLKKLN